MSTDALPRRVRPYWHVDAKWITGLLLLWTLSYSLILYHLYQFSAREPATQTLSLALGAGLSVMGGFQLDDPALLDQLQQRLAATPGQPIEIIPGLALTIQPEDLVGKTPRQAMALITDQLAGPIYDNGVQGLADLAQDPVLQQAIIDNGTLFNVLTMDTHLRLERSLQIMAGVSGFLLLLLIVFSARFGRIGSPGCVLFVVGLPGIFLWVVSRGLAQRVAALPDRSAGALTFAGYVLSQALPERLATLTQNYLLTLVIGICLLALAILGGLVWRVARD